MKLQLLFCFCNIISAGLHIVGQIILTVINFNLIHLEVLKVINVINLKVDFYILQS